MNKSKDGQAYFTTVKMGTNSSLSVELNLPESMDPIDRWFFKITRITAKGTASIVNLHCRELTNDRSYNNTLKTNDQIAFTQISASYTTNIDPISETSIGYPINQNIVNNPNVVFYLTDENYASYSAGNYQFEICVFFNPKS